MLAYIYIFFEVVCSFVCLLGGDGGGGIQRAYLDFDSCRCVISFNFLLSQGGGRDCG